MTFVVIGISHKEAPVEVREKFFLNPHERREYLERLREDTRIREAVVISTCNRTEIYANVVGDKKSAGRAMVDKLFVLKRVERAKDLEDSFFCMTGSAGIRHFMEVATGLDSLVLGEKQILGQIKKAIDMSREAGMMAKEFNLLSNIVIRVGKKAQNETQIGCGGASVSWAAVQLAEKALGSIAQKSILIVGAGKMSELTAAQLVKKGVREPYVVNRTRHRAESLAARIGGRAHSYLDMYKILCRVDLCIVSASAPSYILRPETMRPIMQKRQEKELVCIDISTPRNIAPGVGDLNGVTLYKIDDLSAIVGHNLQRRQAAVTDVERMIENKLREYQQKRSNNGRFRQMNLPDFSLYYSG